MQDSHFVYVLALYCRSPRGLAGGSMQSLVCLRFHSSASLPFLSVLASYSSLWRSLRPCMRVVLLMVLMGFRAASFSLSLPRTRALRSFRGRLISQCSAQQLSADSLPSCGSTFPPHVSI